MAIDRVEAALEDIRRGKMVILVGDESKENEGDLAMAAEFVTPEAVNFMAREGRGLICLTLTDALQIAQGQRFAPINRGFKCFIWKT